MTEIKNCRTCAHCEIHSSSHYDYCILCGEQCWIVRKYSNHFCDKNLSQWTPRKYTQIFMDNRFPIVIIGSLFFIVLSTLFNN